MQNKTMLAGLLSVGLAGAALAGGTGSSPGVVNPGHSSGSPTNNSVALLETTTTALGEVLTSLGVTYDDYQGPPFPTNLTQYTTVLLGMDGGLLEGSDIQNLAAYASAGGNLVFFGGTCWQDYAVAMDTYLVRNDTNNYCWTEVMNTPAVRIVDPENPLSLGLPETYNFTNWAASYYQFRTTDPAISVAADNGDGYHMLFSKTIGSGRIACCINSAYASYWAGADLDWMTTAVRNMYSIYGIVPTKSVSWGGLKATFRRAR